MTRHLARDLSGNSPSSNALVTESNRHFLIFNSAFGETGTTYWARDFPVAQVYVVDVEIGAGDTVLLEVRADNSAAWATKESITTTSSRDLEPSEQFRIRRSVDGGNDTKVWLTPRKQ
jgi:hypothetical protein